MSTRIRILHIFLFELCALILVTPLASVILHTSMGHMFTLALTVSIIASIWNFAYNYFFDKVEAHFGGHRSKRGPLFRIFHTCLFEAGLIIVTVPLVAYWLSMTLVHAFIVDIGFVMFFLVYAFFFNWGFDYIYYHLIPKYHTKNKT